MGAVGAVGAAGAAGAERESRIVNQSIKPVILSELKSKNTVHLQSSLSVPAAPAPCNRQQGWGAGKVMRLL